MRTRALHALLLGSGLLLAAAMATADEDAAPASPAREAETGRKTALVSRMVLKVTSPAEARALLIARAEELGGFPVVIADDRLWLEVPPRRLDELLQHAAEAGLLLDRTLERRDLTLEIAKLEGTLEARREVLARLRGFFDDSDVRATLRIEQNMTSLVAEIEQIRGRLRVLRHRASHARVEISFNFEQRDRIVYVHSPFEWLNTVGLEHFLREF